MKDVLSVAKQNTTFVAAQRPPTRSCVCVCARRVELVVKLVFSRIIGRVIVAFTRSHSLRKAPVPLPRFGINHATGISIASVALLSPRLHCLRRVSVCVCVLARQFTLSSMLTFCLTLELELEHRTLVVMVAGLDRFTSPALGLLRESERPQSSLRPLGRCWSKNNGSGWIGRIVSGLLVAQRIIHKGFGININHRPPLCVILSECWRRSARWSGRVW